MLKLILTILKSSLRNVSRFLGSFYLLYKNYVQTPSHVQKNQCADLEEKGN